MFPAALGQQAAPPQKSPAAKKTAAAKPQRLSDYMREVGLLYIEAVNDAVDAMTDAAVPSDLREDLSTRRFQLVTQLEDRIDIHSRSKADDAFYSLGLKPLRTMAEARASARRSLHTLIGYRPRGASIEQQDEWVRKCEHVSDALIEPYTRCEVGLRAIIKRGQYESWESVDRACPLEAHQPNCLSLLKEADRASGHDPDAAMNAECLKTRTAEQCARIMKTIEDAQRPAR